MESSRGRAFCNKPAAVANLIKDSNPDIGLTAHPSGQRAMNANRFQLSMIAYNLNGWLEPFEREESVTVPGPTHQTISTTRSRLLRLPSEHISKRRGGTAGPALDPVCSGAKRRCQGGIANPGETSLPCGRD